MDLLIYLLFRNVSLVVSIMVLIQGGSIRIDVTVSRLWVLASIRNEGIRRSWPVENLCVWVCEILNIFINLLFIDLSSIGISVSKVSIL